MGRIKIHKQNVKTQIHSVEAKSLFLWLVNQTRHRYGVASEEAKLIAEKAEHLMNEEWKLHSANRFYLPLCEGKENHQKRSNATFPQIHVCLTAFSYEDLNMQLNHGLKAMQNSRIFRLLEEAYAQDATFSAHHLCLLTHTTAKSIRERLIPLWNRGIRLPVQGMALKYRNHRQFRSTYALEHYFRGVAVKELQSYLFFSDSLWHRWQRDFLQVAGYPFNQVDPTNIASVTGFTLEIVLEYMELKRKICSYGSFEAFIATHECAIGDENIPNPIEVDLLFLHDLEINHNFSKAKSRMYLSMLIELKEQHLHIQRKPETVIYFAVSSDESAGKALIDCRLIPVQLSWWTMDDHLITDLNSTEPLKWQKILRLSTEARQQGACLNQADLAYLLAMHPEVIQRMTKEHDSILLPTRGNVADMGPGLTHAEQIIELYLQGYTETEIVRRTGHTYASIENYIMMFSRVVALLERKMPIPLIRQTIGCSMKLTLKHAALYDKYNTPDYQFMLMQIRRIFESHSTKKKEIPATPIYKRRTLWDVQRKE